MSVDDVQRVFLVAYVITSIVCRWVDWRYWATILVAFAGVVVFALLIAVVG